MEFHQGRGFTAINLPNQTITPDATEIVRGIVIDNPRSNGTQIKGLAKPLGVGKTWVDEILSSGDYAIEQGRGAAKLYTYMPKEERVSDFPNPGVEEIRKSQ